VDEIQNHTGISSFNKADRDVRADFPASNPIGLWPGGMEGKNSIFDPIIGFGFGNLPETDLFRMLFALNFHMKRCPKDLRDSAQRAQGMALI
jgi:hypothetical protein